MEQRAAAQYAVDTHVRSGMLVALGCGPLVALATEYLGRKLAAGSLVDVTAVASCAQAAAEASFHAVPLAAEGASSQSPDVLLEQPDELALNDSTLAFLVGRERAPAQPELLRAQRLREMACSVVLLLPQAALLPALTGPVPVLLEAEYWEEGAEGLDDAFIGDAELWRRPMSGFADPLGGDRPYISPEGHALVDLVFEDGLMLAGQPASAAEVAAEIEATPGVLAHGLGVGVELTCAIVAVPGSTMPQVLFPSA